MEVYPVFISRKKTSDIRFVGVNDRQCDNQPENQKVIIEAVTNINAGVEQVKIVIFETAEIKQVLSYRDNHGKCYRREHGSDGNIP